ncbi:hypothetical protein P7K49_027719, partial [Saguinus oedipus]
MWQSRPSRNINAEEGNEKFSESNYQKEAGKKARREELSQVLITAVPEGEQTSFFHQIQDDLQVTIGNGNVKSSFLLHC